MILVTGASGSAGGAVLQAATAAGLAVRAMYRSHSEAAKAPSGVSTVVADFADAASLHGALEGIDAVFLVSSPVPELVQLESNMIDACKQAGTRHLVLSSALGAGAFPKSFPSWHFQVEQKLQASGLGYTILRPNGFMQNIVAYNAPTIRTQNAFYAALSDTRISLIDVRDVGAVAGKVLETPQAHAGKIYELNGPEALSNYDVADRISRIIGRNVSYVDIPEQAQHKAMLDGGMPESRVKPILELEEYYRSGRCGVVDGLVALLTGRPERTLDQYLRENAAAFQVQAASA
jgi:uncharacterized protein YbjT (DUF2867 family)